MTGGRALVAAIVAGALLGPAAALLVPSAAGAQPPPAAPSADEARARARSLANEGLRAFKSGDYVTALARFEQAEALVPAPTIALQRARSLEKLGRLAEALDRYQAIVDAPPATDAPYVHHRAHQDAGVELAALEPRVPSVLVLVEGDPGRGAELLIDGRSAPWSGAGDRTVRRLDPGPHRFEVRRRDGSRATAEADLVERGRAEVRLVLPPPGTLEGDDEIDAGTTSSSGWTAEEHRAAGWVAISAGGLGLGLALVTGAAAVALGSDLDGRCPGGTCPPEAWDDVDAHDGYRTASTLGFVLAGALVTTGVVLLVTAPETDPATGAARGPRAEARLGGRGVALRVDY